MDATISKVLVVDDEEGLRYVLQRQLKSAGFDVDTASDGQEAVEKMRETHYHVVVSDMKMPRLDGMGVLAAAKEISPETDVIILTGHGSLENAVAAFKAGNLFEYLLKPLDDIAVLSTLVSRAIEQQQLRAKNQQLYDELQQAYIDLKSKSEQLIQVEKMSAIGQLAAGVAHELNNPMTAVLGFTEFLHEKLVNKDLSELTEQETERIRSAMKNIVMGAHRCRDIVQSLLRFSRSTQKGCFSEVDLKTVLKDTFVFTEHMLLRHGISLVSEFDESDIQIQGNSGRLQQVFTNLILNAQQATPDGGQVTVRCRRTDATAVIEVSDSGCGIPPDKIDSIFEPFFTTKDEGQGTGLGLSIAKQIVEEHGGTISASSPPGQGATFTVSLPCAAPEAAMRLSESSAA